MNHQFLNLQNLKIYQKRPFANHLLAMIINQIRISLPIWWTTAAHNAPKLTLNSKLRESNQPTTKQFVATKTSDSHHLPSESEQNRNKVLQGSIKNRILLIVLRLTIIWKSIHQTSPKVKAYWANDSIQNTSPNKRSIVLISLIDIFQKRCKKIFLANKNNSSSVSFTHSYILNRSSTQHTVRPSLSDQPLLSLQFSTIVL